METQLLNRLVKAVTDGTLQDLVPEDLEAQIYTSLWTEFDREFAAILKVLPHTTATSVRHRFAVMTKYGSKRHNGFFLETGLPIRNTFSTARTERLVKLHGVRGGVFLLAAMENTLSMEGGQGAVALQRSALRLATLENFARQLYFSDTSEVRGGEAGSSRWRGIIQSIREGTDGTEGTISPNGSHVIDMEGQPITEDTLRTYQLMLRSLWGNIGLLMMPGTVRSDLEKTLDTARKLELPSGITPYTLGQQVDGVMINGRRIPFVTDQTLDPAVSWGPYEVDEDPPDEMPTGLPTVTIQAQADNATTDTVTSKWDTDSAGDIFYVITEVIKGVEGLGRRVPETPGTYTTIAAGQEMRLQITPSSSQVESFRIYRGKSDTGGELTDAWLVKEVAAGTGLSQITWFDNNLRRPRTAVVVGLDLVSTAQKAFMEGRPYSEMQKDFASYTQQGEMDGNGVSFARLGPFMGVMALANTTPLVDNPLVFTAGVPVVRRPRRNIVFINVGAA